MSVCHLHFYCYFILNYVFLYRYCGEDRDANTRPKRVELTSSGFQLMKEVETVFVNNQIDAQFFFMYIYFYSVRVSSSHVPIIRRINCINTTSGICHSVYVTFNPYPANVENVVSF